MNDEVISAFANLCGYRDLDPVATLAFLTAQDWSLDDDVHISTAGLTIHEEPEDDDDDYISTAGLKIREDAVMTPVAN